MNLFGRFVSSARGAGASKPLRARIENTIPPSTPPHPVGAATGLRGATADDPGPGFSRKVIPSASIINISSPPRMVVVRVDRRMPK